jgi:hypothetical protein
LIGMQRIRVDFKTEGDGVIPRGYIDAMLSSQLLCVTDTCLQESSCAAEHCSEQAPDRAGALVR